ncbi:hypothetical protein F8M41_019722 [Gigaspora margarita]|uniref:Uncharacterized protein n=1 Tax=Gigaspora margarita TaxID=4874 RepID=A0A8H4EKF2_GIGMA|nr:hypothetical protein F8M41_019722 [Gigaspora margarita]
MLIRALTPEQGKEKKDYNGWSDIKTEVKEIKSKWYQRLAKKDHTCKTDDSHDTSWYCGSGSKLEGVGERRPLSLKTRRKVSMNYQKIVSERESEQFNQEKKENIYTKSRKINPVAAPKDLYKKEKEEGVNDKENDSAKLMQELLIVYNTLSQKITQDKNETPEVNAEPKNLVLNLIKEVLVKAELEKRKDPTFGSYWGPTEMGYSCKMDKIDDNLGLKEKIVMDALCRNSMPTSWKIGSKELNQKEIKIEELE